MSLWTYYPALCAGEKVQLPGRMLPVDLYNTLQFLQVQKFLAPWPRGLSRAYYLALPADVELYSSLAAFKIEPTTWHFLQVQKSSSLASNK